MTQPTEPTDAGTKAPDTDADELSGAEATDEPEAPEDESPEASPNSEAARWRRQLRDVEAERDALAERVQHYQRRECEATVADLLDVPADLFDIGQIDPADFYNDGQLDADMLRLAAGTLLEERPRLGKPQPAGPRWANFGQYAPPPPSPGATWGGLLKG